MNNKEKVMEKKIQLMKLTTAFTNECLDEEYQEVIEKLINKMARKREVPFLTGKIEIWAAAVIHAVGSINFLFDKSTEPYVSVTDINAFFDTKQSTTSQKSKRIRDMFKMTYFDKDFSIKLTDAHNPFHTLTSANGYIVPKGVVNEPIVRPHVLDDWELRVAGILGITNSEKGKNYSNDDIFNLLGVTVDSLLCYYQYLEKHVTFPFNGTLEQETGPFSVIEYDVTCTRFGEEIVVHDMYGILLEGKIENKEVVIPLAEIDLDEDNPNYSLVDDYLSWFWNYR